MDLWKGKVAVVTGASAGIGAAVTEALAAAGINVIGLARRKEIVEELATESASLPGKIYAVQCDVRDSSSIKSAFAWVQENLGGVDILINNAGIVRRILMFNDDSESELLNTIQTNFIGALLCAKEAYKSFKERDSYGYIINVNSIAGHQTCFPPDFHMNIYPATKHAITAMTDTMRFELLSLNNRKVRVSSISPGVVKTEIHRNAGAGDKIYEFLPHLESSDVANAILFMLSTPPDVHVSIVFDPFLRKLEDDFIGIGTDY